MFSFVLFHLVKSTFRSTELSLRARSPPRKKKSMKPLKQITEGARRSEGARHLSPHPGCRGRRTRLSPSPYLQVLRALQSAAPGRNRPHRALRSAAGEGGGLRGARESAENNKPEDKSYLLLSLHREPQFPHELTEGLNALKSVGRDGRKLLRSIRIKLPKMS